MLQLDDLVLVEGDFRLTANWSVAPGERVAVIGPSGAGKSTLLMAIAGFFAPAQGRILWQGRDITALEPASRPISILFQDQNLFPHLTVAQNLALGLNSGRRLNAADEARIVAALNRTGLSGFYARKPAQLSGGQQGRAALARALLRARPVLLLDEPFAALGPALKSEMLTLVCDVAEEQAAAVLMVTHDPADAIRLGGKTVLVADGVAYPPMATYDLFANPPRALTDYLGTAPAK